MQLSYAGPVNRLNTQPFLLQGFTSATVVVKQQKFLPMTVF